MTEEEAQYTFEINRESETWTCLNDKGQEIDSGELPLTNAKRAMAIFKGNGVANPVRDAMHAYISGDWEDSYEQS